MDINPKTEDAITFPHCTVLKASAGAGKTHALTLRYASFTLSDAKRIPNNDLRNILAITFSNNAAKEMKERILAWLKAACLNDAGSLEHLMKQLSLPAEGVRRRAGAVLDHILDNYTDFQVRTIDSFMTTVFKASAIDFGFNPDFEIILDSRPLLVYSFDLFLRRIRQGSPDAEILGSIISHIVDQKDGDSGFLWDPSAAILEQIKGIYQRLSATALEPLMEDRAAEMAELKKKITAEVRAIGDLLTRSGLKPNGTSSFTKSHMLKVAAEGRHSYLFGKEFKTAPVGSLKKGEEAHRLEHARILDHWERVKSLFAEFAGLYARSFYSPYLRVYDGFRQTLEAVKRRQERIFIGDIGRTLAQHSALSEVPDIYFRLGETIYHYQIDEFQDTSPVQWTALQPLIENSLSQGGSLFVVGDTKQAIYGFRNADYTIMQDLEHGSCFESVEPVIENLDRNFRSCSAILDFTEAVFKKAVAQNPDYGRYAALSGLTDYVQMAQERDGDRGHAEVRLLERNDEEPPERDELLRIIEDLLTRHFRYSGIAVLTPKNEDAVRVSGWLNEKNIPFISYSNLDIRRRKITGEVISLLNFLDSPIDNHAFASFILSSIFLQTQGSSGESCLKSFRELILSVSGREPLYKAFQRAFPALWERYFSGLFRVAGYFPLYDLAVEAFSTFRLLELFRDEEATLVKILEVIKDFEGSGFNSLRDFLDFAEEENADASAWNMDVPKNIEAVKVMTVHKAKGLGFPAVILLQYRSKPKSPEYIEQKEPGGGLRLLKITQKLCISSPELEPLYQEAAAKDWVSRLNSLYVGLTRAKEEMYVLGVKDQKDTFPFDILPLEEFPQACATRTHKAGQEQPPECPVLHRQDRIAASHRSSQMISLAERRRGEFIHLLLSRVLLLGLNPEQEVKEAAAAALQQAGSEYNVGEMTASVMKMLADEAVKSLFLPMPGRRVLNEQPVVDAEGSLFRIDRLVIDESCATVVEYKTGSDRGSEQQHLEQVKHYLSLVEPLLDGLPVCGMLVYVDTGKVVTVR